MSRPVAFVAFVALLWSHVAGLHCDMGGSTVAMAAGHADVATHAGTTPADHGGGHGCRMIMACSIASPRPAHPATMIRIPTVLVRAAFATPPTPVAADLAVETPPPRHAV